MVLFCTYVMDKGALHVSVGIREETATNTSVLPHSDFDALNEEDVVKNNQLAFDVAEQEFGIPPVTTGKEVGSAGEPDKLSMVMYLSKFYELFRGTPLRAVGKPNPGHS